MVDSREKEIIVNHLNFSKYPLFVNETEIDIKMFEEGAEEEKRVVAENNKTDFKGYRKNKMPGK